MVRNITLDNPAERQEDDEFNRWAFSQRLAATIAEFDASQGAPVFGLFGKWGSGKSTVLNFVRAVLEKDYGSRVTVFAFNPWLLKDQDALLQEFFVGLGRSVNAKVEKVGKTIGELMMRYGGALRIIPLYGDAAAIGINKLGEDISKDSIQQQRDRLTQAMHETTEKVVVLIDDLDRLDHNEIMTVLKMVRLSANFPNVIYLLAFDEERVGRIAADAYGEAADGRQFLEKIIQYPFSLPAVSSDRLAAYVMKHARSACDTAGIGIDRLAWDEFCQICKDALLVVMTTPRHAIRYANALRFALPMLKGEVDPFDQMIIEATRIFFPYAYIIMQNGPNISATDLDYEVKSRRISPVEGKAAKRLFEVLLSRQPPSTKPITDSRYHGRYFSYAVAVDDISDMQLRSLLALSEAGDQAAVDTAVRDLASKRLDILIERLSSSLEPLSVRSANCLAIALAQVGDILPASPPIEEQALALATGDLIAKLCRHDFLRRLGMHNGQGNFVAGRVIECATSLPFALVIYRELESLEKAEQKAWDEEASSTDGDSTFPKHEWTELRDNFCRRIAADARSKPPYAQYSPIDALSLLKFWRDANSDEERTWLEQRLADHPCEVVAVLGMFPGSWFELLDGSIASLLNPSAFARTLESFFGGALTDVYALSDGIEAARAFLFGYRKKMSTPNEAPPTL